MSRKQFTIEEQFGIICRVDSGTMKRRVKIIMQFNKCEKGKRVRSSNHSDIESALLDWFKQQRANNVPVGGPILQVKADALAVILKKDFKCNASWVNVSELATILSMEKFQSIDQGVIRSLKECFRKELVYKIIEKRENNDDTKVSIFNGILLISKAWESVRKETIINCFRFSGLTNDLQPSGIAYNDIAQKHLQDAVSLLSSDCSADDYVRVDDKISTSEELSDIDIVLSHQTSDKQSTDEADEELEDFGKIPTVAEAYAACSTIRAFIQTAETSQIEKMSNNESRFIKSHHNLFLRLYYNTKKEGLHLNELFYGMSMSLKTTNHTNTGPIIKKVKDAIKQIRMSQS
ncbi:uncharacterized protein [Diabrotica undecimpunctata]|uniref:uncharacterized protein n=1 Tax=Diabrotica undecimpunctata TaxID=50387 RepID=UPI003B632AC5